MNVPPDGTEVDAMTFPNEDEEIPAREVRGRLSRTHVKALDYVQYVVGGIGVDPSTIRKTSTEDDSESVQEEGFTGTKTDSIGRVRQYENGKQVAISHSPTGTSTPAHAAEPEHAGAISSALPAIVHAAEPEVHAKPGLMEWIKKHAIAAAAKTYVHLQKLTPAMLKAMDVAGIILDTPNDLKRWFAYNPTLSAGTASGEANKGMDPMQHHLGISSHLAATVASHVLAAGITMIRRKLAGKATEEFEGNDLQAFSEIMAESLKELAFEFGLTPPPDAAAIHERLLTLGV